LSDGNENQFGFDSGNQVKIPITMQKRPSHYFHVAICARLELPLQHPGAPVPSRASRRPISIGRQFGRDAPPIA
jgi:hypothetical protein